MAGWLWELRRQQQQEEEQRRRRPFAVVLGAATSLLLLLLCALFFSVLVFASGVATNELVSFSWTRPSSRGGNHSSLPFSPPRKLLLGRALTMVQPDRIWGEKCTNADIVINQGPTAPLPTGIPTYTVEIMNACVTGCDISGIHLNCGWFSSARLINPKIFKRLRYNDCLVNDGKPLVNGGTLSFEYANTYLYPLSVSKVICA